MSILITALVFKYFGLSINTMTLGGLAIAIGGLVDDAVVGVENVLRRMKQDRHAKAHHVHLDAPDRIDRPATMEVRSAILYATVIIVLVFVPLFALPGMEGRLFVPLGIAYHRRRAGLAAGLGDADAGLAFYLLPRHEAARPRRHQAAAPGSRRGYQSSLCRPCWTTQGRAGGGRGMAVLVAAAPCRSSPRPSCRRSTKASLLVGMRLNPGMTLAETIRLARQAEVLLQAGARGDRTSAGAAAAPNWTSMPKACTSANSTWRSSRLPN